MKGLILERRGGRVARRLRQDQGWSLSEQVPPRPFSPPPSVQSSGTKGGRVSSCAAMPQNDDWQSTTEPWPIHPTAVLVVCFLACGASKSDTGGTLPWDDIVATFSPDGGFLRLAPGSHLRALKCSPRSIWLRQFFCLLSPCVARRTCVWQRRSNERCSNITSCPLSLPTSHSLLVTSLFMPSV